MKCSRSLKCCRCPPSELLSMLFLNATALRPEAIYSQVVYPCLICLCGRDIWGRNTFELSKTIHLDTRISWFNYKSQRSTSWSSKLEHRLVDAPSLHPQVDSCVTGLGVTSERWGVWSLRTQRAWLFTLSCNYSSMTKPSQQDRVCLEEICGYGYRWCRLKDQLGHTVHLHMEETKVQPLRIQRLTQMTCLCGSAGQFCNIWRHLTSSCQWVQVARYFA